MLEWLGYILSFVAGTAGPLILRAVELHHQRKTMRDTKLFEHQWGVIQDFYSRLDDFDRALMDCADIQPGPDEILKRTDKACEVGNSLNQIIRRNAIFLHPDFCDAFKEFWKKIREVVYAIQSDCAHGSSRLSEPLRLKLLERRETAEDFILTKFSAEKATLEEHLRKVVGTSQNRWNEAIPPLTRAALNIAKTAARLPLPI